MCIKVFQEVSEDFRMGQSTAVAFKESSEGVSEGLPGTLRHRRFKAFQCVPEVEYKPYSEYRVNQ